MMSGLEDSAEDRNMREVCRRFHIKIGRIYRSDGIDTNMRLVREGTGVALGPASFADYYQVAAVPLDPELWVSLQFVCLKSTLKRPEVRQFRDYLQAICKQRESLAGTV
jgi:DNA-binding transcriptional LysR family regulator